MRKINLLIALCIGILMTYAPYSSAQVFINEIHYDNVGNDAKEALELAGPAGTDLTGYLITFYDGATGALYDSFTISVVIPDQQNGFGAIAVFRKGLENGAPDGIGLVDNNGRVLEFLSYEGSFQAVDGPLAGMRSTDIGVAEDENTLPNESLQLTGVGTNPRDFTWVGPLRSSMGFINAGQTFEVPPAMEFLINEVRIAQPHGDTDEYFEIKGAPGESLNEISYLVIGDAPSGGSGVVETVISLKNQQLRENGLFLVARPGFSLGNPDLAVPFHFEDNDNVTHLLVAGFTGTVGEDLDLNDDGNLEIEPWASVLDHIAIIKSDGSGSETYGENWIGPDGSFIPSHIFRDENDVFQIGNFDPAQGGDTPGRPNSELETPTGLRISGFVAFNPKTAQPSTAFSFDEATNLAVYQAIERTDKFNIKAIAEGKQVGRVEFQLSGPIHTKRTEKYFPYFLFGDHRRGKKIFGKKLKPGNYELTATPYTKRKGGASGVPLTVRFAVEEGTLEIKEFYLVDAKRDVRLEKITDGQVLDVSQYDTRQLSIEVVPEIPQVGSVTFRLESPERHLYRTENFVPYALFGDRRGNFYGRDLKPGEYSLAVTPYSLKWRRGVKGTTKQLNFIIDQQATPANGRALPVAEDAASPETLMEQILVEAPFAFHTFPNPSPGEVTFQFDGDEGINIELTVYDAVGKLVYHHSATSRLIDQVDFRGWGRGWYVAHLQIPGKVFTQKLIID